MSITIERRIDNARLAALGVEAWPTWGKGRSIFAWHYDREETSYFVRGEVVVIRAGDLVTFGAGLSCTWEIGEELLKHYCI